MNTNIPFTGGRWVVSGLEQKEPKMIESLENTKIYARDDEKREAIAIAKELGYEVRDDYDNYHNWLLFTENQIKFYCSIAGDYKKEITLSDMRALRDRKQYPVVNKENIDQVDLSGIGIGKGGFDSNGIPQGWFYPGGTAIIDHYKCGCILYVPSSPYERVRFLGIESDDLTRKRLEAMGLRDRKRSIEHKELIYRAADRPENDPPPYDTPESLITEFNPHPNHLGGKHGGFTS